MKIEKGKFYRTRDGYKVEILKTDAKKMHPIIGLITRSEDREVYSSWSDNGMYLKNAYKSSYDIISEWEEALDFDPYCLPKWADKWIAMNEDGQWYSFIKKPTLKEGWGNWSIFHWDEESEIPERFRPKNYTGDWKDSLFDVEQLKKDKECQYK